MSNEVYCNECSKTFSIDVKEKKYSKGIREVYFICPHCNKRYISYRTNGAIRRMQGQIRNLEQQQHSKTRQLIDENRHAEVPDMIDSIDKEIESIKQQIKTEMDKLNDLKDS